jgi:hypothetical protein
MAPGGVNWRCRTTGQPSSGRVWPYDFFVHSSSRWWRRFRRSFGIPDLLTDEHACSIIVASLSPGIGNSGTTVLDPTPAITAILESAVELAESGQLDDLILPISQQILELEGSPRTRIIQVATARQEWPRDPVNHGSMQVSNAIGEAVNELLDRVSRSLKALPFEDAEGHYFASAYDDSSTGGVSAE